MTLSGEAAQAVTRALARSESRAAAPVKYLDNATFRKQKAALTRAKNSGDPNKVVLACRDAVRLWNDGNYAWPDDWARWQRALDDTLPWHQHVALDELA